MNTAKRKSSDGQRPRTRPSRGRGLRTSTGCLTCRERRVKCDDGKPKCLRCTKSNRYCRYGPVAERQTTASESQKSTSSSPAAVAQQQPVEATYFQPAAPERSNDQALSSLDPDSTSPLALSQISLLDISPFEWYDLLARDAINNIQRSNEAAAGGPRWNFPEITLSRRQTPAPECAEPRIETSLLGYHVSEPWNTNERIELSPVDLIFLRYYTEVVGPILDLFDPARHFTNVVPHLGIRNTGLLKSILAVGAKHMSLSRIHHAEDVRPSDGHGPRAPSATDLPEPDPAPAHMAAQYYYETLQYLSQTLLYPSYADSREILATSTMISTYEMFDADRASTTGDWERHLRGSFWIQRSQDNDGESADGLRRAVWWAWLRQDIWAAFQAGRPTLTIWRAKKKLEELDADELATRIVYICAQCVEFAASDKMQSAQGAGQGQDPRQRIEQGDRLLRALDDWYRVLPSSYQPVTVAMDPGSARALSLIPSSTPGSSGWDELPESQEPVFPPVWIHPPNHAGAMQMYHFGKAVVLLNQPTMGGLNAYCLREKQLSESVQMVCGIANACQEHEAAIAFVNVQTLFGVGQFVQAPNMRAELLRSLENNMRICKFPARGLIARLKKMWQG
ncbi:hypothetical protein BDW62DRAFT_220565 [Aspergillus aurantiobrunneus]